MANGEALPEFVTAHFLGSARYARAILLARDFQLCFFDKDASGWLVSANLPTEKRQPKNARGSDKRPQLGKY